MKRGLHLHVIHVSGQRMIRQGSDGLWRGDHTQGSMGAVPIRTFIPLHLLAFDQSPELLKWMKCVTYGMEFQYLDPAGWFEHHHGFGNYVWSPPPAACKVVIEQLAKARWKRPESLHLIIVPRLMTGRWRRHLTRGTDKHFELVDAPWSLAEQCKPLLIFFCLPIGLASPGLRTNKGGWRSMEGQCSKCKVWIKGADGLFCANYCWQRGRTMMGIC